MKTKEISISPTEKIIRLQEQLLQNMKLLQQAGEMLKDHEKRLAEMEQKIDWRTDRN